MISDEAVEAAARMMAHPAPYNFDAYPQYWTERARLVLEAAAPYMPCPDAASVWDEAANVLYMGNSIAQDHLKAMWERNPYRSQS